MLGCSSTSERSNHALGSRGSHLAAETTAIRGGYAVYHDSAWNQGAQGLWQNPPYYAEVDQFGFFVGTRVRRLTPHQLTPTNCGLKYGFLQQNPTTAALFPLRLRPIRNAFTGTIHSQNFNFKQGTVQQFNLNVEHQLPGNVVVYRWIRRIARHHILMDGQNLNVGSPSACGVAIIGVHARLRRRAELRSTLRIHSEITTSRPSV